MSTTPTVWAGLDPSKREAFTRAINVSGAGSVLVQNFTNRIIQQLSIREFGALGTMDRKPGSGSAAIINRRTASTMTTSDVWVADTDAVVETTGSYAQASFTYATLATRGKVTRKMRARGRSYIDILAEEMMQKADDFNEALESCIFIGDSGASGDANMMNGLLTLVNAVAGQVVAQTSAGAGGALTLAKLDETIDVVRGAGNRSDLVIYGSFKGIRKLNAALQAQQQFINEVEIAAGFRVRTYDGIPLVVSTGMRDDLGWSGTAVTKLGGEVTNPTTALVVVNKRFAYLEELTPMTMMPLATTDSQFDQFDIYWDGAVVLANTKGAALLAGIAGT